jgi:hypothetical protein
MRHRTRPVPVSVPRPQGGTAGATSKVAPNELAKPLLVSRGGAEKFSGSRGGSDPCKPERRIRNKNTLGDVSIPCGHRPPFTTAPVADSQRSSDPLLFTTSARADSQRRWLPSSIFRNAMDDPYALILGMFALAVTAVMLVAGELYLVTRPEQPETHTPPASIVTSSIR